MRQVRHLLEGKSGGIFAIAPDAPVLEAIKSMAEHLGVGVLGRRHGCHGRIGRNGVQRAAPAFQQMPDLTHAWSSG